MNKHSDLTLSKTRGPWVAQLVKQPTLDFGSGDDLRVMRFGLGSRSQRLNFCLVTTDGKKKKKHYVAQRYLKAEILSHTFFGQLLGSPF